MIVVLVESYLLEHSLHWSSNVPQYQTSCKNDRLACSDQWCAVGDDLLRRCGPQWVRDLHGLGASSVFFGALSGKAVHWNRDRLFHRRPPTWQQPRHRHLRRLARARPFDHAHDRTWRHDGWLAVRPGPRHRPVGTRRHAESFAREVHILRPVSRSTFSIGAVSAGRSPRCSCRRSPAGCSGTLRNSTRRVS